MTGVPLDIRFIRSGGRRVSIDETFRDVELTPEDIAVWMGVDPPHIPYARHPSPDVSAYRLEFRRGAERRVVEFTRDALDTRLEPLVTRLETSVEGR